MLTTLIVLSTISAAVTLVCLALVRGLQNQLHELRLDQQETHALLCDWLMEDDGETPTPAPTPWDSGDYTWEDTHAN